MVNIGPKLALAPEDRKLTRSMMSGAVRYVVLLALALAIAGRATSGSAQAMAPVAPGVRYFMPDAAASKLVTVTVSGRAALSMTAWVFTFHREGLYDFRCAVHQPEMSGQILVLPPARRR